MRQGAEGRSTEERREGGDRDGPSRRWSCCASCDARLAEDLAGDGSGRGREMAEVEGDSGNSYQY